ncbi:TRAP transporter small permease subunit [Rhizobium sp. 9140]|uniref:TRAP transporter small permease subunit n=1 Tax=Rhizobium sp. 9140 TaxID=1761900 RepID=UPI000793DA85|nr:TRAP transporter small permease [Rhizobium sp. 9140]CZT37909.1 TRAP-type mannitol/chloroaromatic compound transport system, small permease component [Rhizobium sp. 9140]
MLTLLRSVSRWSVWISGGLLLLSALLVGLEVLMRSLFQHSFGGVDEISSYIFAIGVAWSLAFTLLHRAHIRIDLVYAKLSSSKRAALDILALAGLIAVTTLLFQQALMTTSTSFELGSRSNTPLGVTLWIPQSIWTAGLGFFLLVQAYLLARIFYLFLTSQHRQVAALSGIKTIDEEIDDEIRT